MYEIRNDEIIRDYECLVIDLFEGHSELIKEIFIEGMIDKIKEEIINDIKHFEHTV